jgi:hypothetical protein
MAVSLDRADALQHVVGAAPGELADAGDALLAALAHLVGGPEAPGDGQPVVVAPHDDDPLGPEPPGGQHGAEADGAVAHHDCRRAGPHAGAEGGVVAGAHDVAEGGERGGQPVVGEVGVGRQRDQRPIGEGHPHGLPLPAVLRPAPVAAAHAGGVEPGAAELADAVGEGERRDDPVARAQRADLVAHGLDHADELVPHAAVAPVDQQLAPVGPEVAAADARVGDADQRVGRVPQRRVGDLLHADVAQAVEDGGLHQAPSVSGQCWVRTSDLPRVRRALSR